MQTTRTILLLLIFAGVLNCQHQEYLPYPSSEILPADALVLPPEPVEETACFIRYPEQMPIFAGCSNLPDYESRKSCSDKKMLEFVYQNICFPKDLRDNWCGGSIMVASFTVDQTGRIGDIRIQRGLHPLLDAELCRVISSMPAFTPAQHAGKPVGVTYNLPIRICLE